MATNLSLFIHQPRLILSIKPFYPSLKSSTGSLQYRHCILRSICFSQNPNQHSSTTASDINPYHQNLNSDGNDGGRVGGLSATRLLDSVTKIDVNPPRGTRDFDPEDMRVRSWLFQKFREVSRLFAFEEVDFPVLESEALFVRKAGEEITEQLYNFEDKGHRRVALRPELTPSLARLVIQKGKSLSLPLKWFAIGQCWRYERMTRGRRREHYQWNMDIIGIPGVSAEAEILFSIVTLFNRLGITVSDVGFKVSSRKVLQEVLQHYCVPEALFGRVCVIIDKMEKIPLEEIKKELNSAGVSPEAITGLVQVLSLKSLSKLEGKKYVEENASGRENCFSSYYPG